MKEDRITQQRYLWVWLICWGEITFHQLKAWEEKGGDQEQQEKLRRRNTFLEEKNNLYLYYIWKK